MVAGGSDVSPDSAGHARGCCVRAQNLVLREGGKFDAGQFNHDGIRNFRLLQSQLEDAEAGGRTVQGVTASCCATPE